MFHGTLALLNQALRTDSRKLSVNLVMLLFVGSLLVMMMQNEMTSFRFGAPGLRLFGSIIWTNYFFILLGGLSFFSSAITEEKEEGTLGLLKMTGMSPVVLLLGKSTSRIIFSSLCLSVQIPFVFLAVTLGGLTSLQILGAYIALAGGLFYIANLALFCSLHSKTNTKAATLFFFNLFLFGAVWGIARMFIEAFTLGFQESGIEWLSMLSYSIYFVFVGPSMIECLYEASSTTFDISVPLAYVCSSLVWGSCFFYVAWRNFEYGTQEDSDLAIHPQNANRPIHFHNSQRIPMEIPVSEKTSEEKPKSTQSESESHTLNTDKVRPKTKVVFRPQNDDQRPQKHVILWKDFNYKAGGKDIMSVKAVIYSLLTILGMLFYSRDVSYFRTSFSGVAVNLGIFFLCLESIWLAGWLFRDEIRDQTWAALVLLPYSFFRIIAEKLLVVVFCLIPSMCMILMGAIIGPDLVFDGLFRSMHSFSSLFYTVVVFLTFLHLIVLLSLYMNRGAVPVSILCFFVWTIFSSFGVEILFYNTFWIDSADRFLLFWLGCLVYLLICGLFQFGIYRRLRTLAAR